MFPPKPTSNVSAFILFDIFLFLTYNYNSRIGAGGTIPGIEVYEEESLSQRAI
jgi:hypothetical protein